MNRRPFPCSVEVNHVDEVVAAGEVAVPKVAIRQKGYLELDCSGRAVGIAEPLIPPSKVRPQGGRRHERIMGPARGGLPPRTDATRPRAGLRHLPGQHRDAGQQHPASVVGHFTTRIPPSLHPGWL